jgi:uncharacterized membrane protein YhaH (DUF805 family)
MASGCAPTVSTGFFEAIKLGMTKAVVFNGRASRSEFWSLVLLGVLSFFIISIVCVWVHVPMVTLLCMTLLFLSIVVLSPAITVRRLHDTGESGWWYLIALTGIGLLALLCWCCIHGEDGDNRYGGAPVCGQDSVYSPTLGVGFVGAIKLAVKKYATFKGRSSRSEFWYVILLLSILVVIVEATDVLLYLIDVVFRLGVYSIDDPRRHVAERLLNVVTFVPSLGITVRRLHDVGRSGWWYFIWPTIIGAFVVLYWLCRKGTSEDNKYGPAPVNQAVSP